MRGLTGGIPSYSARSSADIIGPACCLAGEPLAGAACGFDSSLPIVMLFELLFG